MDMMDDGLNQLRNKVKEEITKSDFKRKLIGGISEEDVESYISAIRMQTEHTVDELNKRIDELVTSRDKLKCEYNIHVESAEEEKKKLLKDLQEANQSIAQLKEQLETKDVYITELKEKHRVELEQLKKRLQEVENEKLSSISMSSEIEPLKQKLQQMESALKENQEKLAAQSNARELAERQLKEERLQYADKNKAIEEQLKVENMSIVKMIEENKELTSRTLEFNHQLSSACKELEGVKEQVKMNEKLKQQLEQERLRTLKAEKEMADFLKSVSELKNSINSNQSLLEGQFKSIGDKYHEMQLDLKGLQKNIDYFKASTGTGIAELFSVVEKASKELVVSDQQHQNDVYEK
jgi:chromosome segregation ATPase